MAKDKKSKKPAKNAKAADSKVALIAGPADGATRKTKSKKAGKSKEHHGLDGLLRLADHPLLGDLLAVGAVCRIWMLPFVDVFLRVFCQRWHSLW